MTMDRDDLVQMRTWIEHWQADVAFNLKPTPESLAEAHKLVSEAIFNMDEEAWVRDQERLMESGGPDDTQYRENLRNAGRGHLLR
jgi:hypothetical protein